MTREENKFISSLQDKEKKTQRLTRERIAELDKNSAKSYEGGCKFLLQWYNSYISDKYNTSI